MTDKFDLPNQVDSNKEQTKINESTDKTIIGAGKSLMDLRKDAALSQMAKDNPANKAIKFDPNTSKSVQFEQLNSTKINHSDNLIKLLSNSFSNHRERINAENKIRKYFDGLK